ncbi:MAG: DEAD/DEAH box helicase [Candidatus Coatesbacteria bacterium]|nr:DEAD/DEAH box helicase [Candidatus Coatesbacteria bacterium]
MTVESFMKNILESPKDSRCVAAVREIPLREARYADVDPPPPEELRTALASMGIERLYAHQARSLELSRGGEDIVVVSITAGGKSLCYNLPVIESLLENPRGVALYMFPTKALSSDQEIVLKQMLDGPGFKNRVISGVYDGDTNSYWKKKNRERANIIITNPDMLHVGILPNHSRWERVFANLKFVVLDEIHTYLGAFGSNVANVLRRLKRICEGMGSRPQFICCSATISNPVELAERITGRRVHLVDDDGAPRSKKHFIIWNPPPISDDASIRPGLFGQARRLVSELVKSDVQTISFTATRMGAEVLAKNVREDLKAVSDDLPRRVKPYRGGYLAQNRRDIERALMERRLLAVVSTSALQLGVDIGSLEASVMVGYPGTIAATWQQAGRAGRKRGESLVILAAGPNPADQYIAQNPDYIFERSSESAVIDPDNPYILTQHICCASVERPLADKDFAYFGPLFHPIVSILENEGRLRRIGEAWYWACDDYPSRETGIRTVTGDRLSIQVWDGNRKGDVIGEIDSASISFIAYPGAIYIHEGETYRVTHVDCERETVTVEKADVPYYTTPMMRHSIKVLETLDARSYPKFLVVNCSANVTFRTVGYMRRRFANGENLGTFELLLDPVVLDTTAAYLMISDELKSALDEQGLSPQGGLVGLKNLIAVTAPMLAMCDPRDLEVIIDSENFERQVIFIFDRFEGGLGFAEKIGSAFEEMLSMCLKVVIRCQCKNGCPSCVGTAVTEQEASGLPLDDIAVPRKDAARRLLELMLES